MSLPGHRRTGNLPARANRFHHPGKCRIRFIYTACNESFSTSSREADACGMIPVRNRSSRAMRFSFVYVVADNPRGESADFPDSNNSMLRSPERAVIRGEHVPYYDGEDD